MNYLCRNLFHMSGKAVTMNLQWPVFHTSLCENRVCEYHLKLLDVYLFRMLKDQNTHIRIPYQNKFRGNNYEVFIHELYYLHQIELGLLQLQLMHVSEVLSYPNRIHVLALFVAYWSIVGSQCEVIHAALQSALLSVIFACRFAYDHRFNPSCIGSTSGST